MLNYNELIRIIQEVNEKLSYIGMKKLRFNAIENTPMRIPETQLAIISQMVYVSCKLDKHQAIVIWMDGDLPQIRKYDKQRSALAHFSKLQDAKMIYYFQNERVFK